jgi:hypothetical protein
MHYACPQAEAGDVAHTFAGVVALTPDALPGNEKDLRRLQSKSAGLQQPLNHNTRPA